ncbi:DUF2461 domain-containing protein [bacterium SCSIO 12741]|nr:DUF2461 domain-containing protein [bacterium SCSIO 12741]
MATSHTIAPESFDYLKILAKNNNRDWFQKNKPTYEKALENIRDVAEDLLQEMGKHDNIETPSGRKSLFRIYRDVRFSKNKAPYKTHWSGHFKRATAELRGGYYFHLEPGNSFVAGGFWGPNPQDLQRIRQEIDLNAEEFREVLNDSALQSTFGNMEGNQVKTAPKGFSKDHPAIDLLRYKQFVFTKRFTDKEVLGKDYVALANQSFKDLRPFFDFMSSVLTTDANGESLI